MYLKTPFYFLISLGLLYYCSACSVQNTNKVNPQEEVMSYPPNLQKIFKRHGGLDQWKSMNSLSFTLTDPESNEKYWVDLNNRRERIEGSNFTMAQDGQQIWLDAKADYTGNPKFYSQLMFYFYAMPFVLADDGINYSDAPDLEFEGKAYPGIKISYNDGVGLSSEDEYFIHYNPETFQMEWLGYTVTYFSKEKSTKVKWIRYDDWQETQKIVLPKSITWYKLEEGKPNAPRNTVKFEEVQLSKKASSDNLFKKPATATLVE